MEISRHKKAKNILKEVQEANWLDRNVGLTCLLIYLVATALPVVSLALFSTKRIFVTFIFV